MSERTGIARRALLAATAASAAAPLARPRAQAPTRLNVGFTAINEYTGLFVAKEEGFFARRGLDVELTLIANNATLPAALISNSVQLGTPSVTTILQAIDGGIPLQFVCGAGVLSAARPSVGVVARSGSNFARPTDFEGKRIAVPGLNALFHVIFRQWLIAGGQNPRGVSFVEVPFAQMFDSLRGGQVEALVTADPARSRIIEANVGYAVGNMLDAIMDNALSGNFAATEGYIAAHRSQLTAFRASIDEGHAFAERDPEATLAHVAKYMRLSPEVLRSLPKPILRSRIDREQVEFWVRVATEQGMLRGRVSVDRLLAGLV